MEENKFEKQVQQKMDELKIHPSDSVWEKIEARIDKRKPSNRRLIWFFLLFCIFLTGTYLLWNTGQHAITVDSKFEKNTSEKNTNEISIKENKTNHTGTNVIASSINKKDTSVAHVVLKKKVYKNSSKQDRFSTAKKLVKMNAGEKAMIVFSKQQDVKDATFENKVTKSVIVQPLETALENKKIKPDTTAFDYTNLTRDSLSKPPSLHDENTPVKDTLQQVLASHKTVKPLKKNKWKPGILFSAGVSGVGNDFLGLVNSPAFDYLNSSAGQGSTPGAVSLPTRTNSAFGFIAGVFAERNISTKARLVTGINFKSFTTSNKVGARNDTTGYFSSLSTVNKYHNHFNFIELPITVKVQIGRGKKMPLFWEGGLVVSELIGSNALQFNPNSGLYYKNNAFFNKTHIGVNTSFSAALFSKQKHPVLVGPYFYYGASRLAGEGLYNKKHFVFTGLRTEIILGK